jgi:ABC-type dipeptide/oligopeptide/nickel transport system permease component
MGRYILGRVAGLVFVLFAVSVIAFLLMHAVPGVRSHRMKRVACQKHCAWPKTPSTFGPAPLHSVCEVHGQRAAG